MLKINSYSHRWLQTTLNLQIIILLVIASAMIPAIGLGQSGSKPDTGKRKDTLKHSVKAVTISRTKPDTTAVPKSNQSNQSTAPLSLNYAKTGAIMTGILCIVICVVILYLLVKSPRDKTQALGLPDGSVRAFIAVLVILFYILIAITFEFSGGHEPSILASDVTKTLGTLVVAVSAFYFGSKVAEQNNKALSENLNKLVDKTQSKTITDVPIGIIQQAIDANNANWMKLYQCQSIKAGKKMASATEQDINCIIFQVANKSTPAGATPIPPKITYVTGGITYEIPTDVVTE